MTERLEVQRAIAAVFLRSDYGLLAKPEVVRVLSQNRLKSTGGESPTWIPWRTGIRARVQPLETRISGEAHTARRYRVFLAESLEAYGVSHVFFENSTSVGL